MITENTVFVLGAGASAPYGFPTGKMLRREICRRFPGQYRRLLRSETHYQKHQGEMEQLVRAAAEFTAAFNSSSTPSIDLYLATSAQFREIGKKAIAFFILSAEMTSKFDTHLANDEIEYDWYSHLFHEMTKELTTPDSYSRFERNRVSFITFNYDRSLEWKLHDSLRHKFMGAPEAAIAEQVEKIPIYHVYGKLGDLDAIPYRSELNYGTVTTAAENIRIVHEREGLGDMELMKIRLREAKRIFFLGFGYARENLDVLDIPSILSSPNAEVVGSGHGFTDREVRNAKASLSPDFKRLGPRPNLDIKKMHCLELLKDEL